MKEMQKQQQLLLDQMVQECSESCDDCGESCEDEIDNPIDNCGITSSVRNVGDFILNADASTSRTMMQLINFTNNVYYEIKTKLLEYDCGTCEGSGDLRKI